jgi:hypothetical protein
MTKMTKTSEPQTNWRFKLGLVMFFAPFAMIAAVPILVPLFIKSATQSAAIIGGILIAGEVIWYASIPLLGKDGFIWIKSKTFGVFALPRGPISPRRHRIGMWMFGIAVTVQETVLAGLIVAYFYLGRDQLTHGLFGMTIETEATLVVYWLLLGTLALIGSAYMLGMPFFERIIDAFSGPQKDD